MKKLESIEYKGHEYNLVFNLNVAEAMQDEYGTIDHWEELCEGGKGKKKSEPDIKAVIFGFMAMLNEGIDIENDEKGTDIKPLTHKEVGRIVTAIGFDNMNEKMKSTIVKSAGEQPKNE